MTADMTRQEVRFIRWDVPARKQEDLLDAVKDGERGRLDYGHCVFTALGESAYCEGLEAAIGMVDLVTKKSFQVLAAQRVKSEGMRNLQDLIELEGPDMNAAYPKVQ